MKQVPAGTKVDIDPETGAMKRLSGDTRTNPYDLLHWRRRFSFAKNWAARSLC